MNITDGCETYDEYLSTHDKVIARDCRLTDIAVTGAVLGGGWVPTCPRAKVERVVHAGTEMSLQLQAKDDKYLKCVHVVLRQDGNNVVARADWVACATDDHDYGFDLSVESNRLHFEGLGIATAAEGDDWNAGYGVAKLFFRRLPMIQVKTIPNTDAANPSIVHVMVRPLVDVLGDEIRVGLHWVKDDDSWGGWVVDKEPRYVGDGWFQADYFIYDVTQKNAAEGILKEQGCPCRFSPVVFFTPDGSFDNAQFKTELGFAKTMQQIVLLDGPVLENLKFVVGALRMGYRIVNSLGHGAMGEVWEVEDMNLCGPHLAMKVFRPQDTENSEKLRERFGREARVLHEISPDVTRSAVRLPRIYRYEQNSQLVNPFYIMDLIGSPDGKPCNLKDVWKRFNHLFDEEHVAMWFEDVCHELSVLHSHHCLHRDIKPENILVDKDGHAVIVDFGTANILAGDFTEDERNDITMVGMYTREQVGTKRYWAPELLSGEPHSKASDIYALAVTFWELLFNGEQFGYKYPPKKQKFENWGESGYKWFKTLTLMLSPDPEDRPTSVDECLKIFKTSRRRRRQAGGTRK